jgi:TPR repeat protein
MVDTSTTDVIEQARVAIDTGDCRTAYDLLRPLLAVQNPAAQFLYATFSISETESDEEFEARSIRLLQSASDAGYAPAMYALAVCLDSGDMVTRNPIMASSFYKKAAEAGYPKAKLSYGLDLIYGSNGIPKDERLGIFMIEQALAEHVDGAAEALDRVRNGSSDGVK